MGCGEEHNKNECDTSGFPMLQEAKVEYDHKHSLKLRLPRNHPRLVQTSTDILQSWRANCDVQFLIYNSDPKNPNIAEIAQVTDYIVSYCTKGNATTKEEKEQNKHMAMA